MAQGKSRQEEWIRRQKRKHELDAEHEAGKRVRCEGEVCKRCRRVDFTKLFTSCKTYRMGSIDQAAASPRCPLCFSAFLLIVADVAFNRLRSARSSTGDVFEDVQYKIYSYRVSPEEHQMRDIPEYYCCAIDYGIRRAGYIRWDAYNRISWDLQGQVPIASSRSATHIVRKLIRPSLDRVWLRKWLDTTPDESSLATNMAFDVIGHNMDGLENLQARGCFRAIDVRTNKIIVLTEPQRYFALSYVWGNFKGDSAVKISDGERVIDWDHLSPAIRDSIQLVNSLGERYLWVDAICIDQSNADEKALVIASMGPIYNCAYATIIAAGDVSTKGLSRLQTDQVKSEGDTPIILLNQQLKIPLTKRARDLPTLLQYTPWNGRAWTWQERKLSRRCIFFFDKEVVCQDVNGIVREAFNVVSDDTSPPEALILPARPPAQMAKKTRNRVLSEFLDYRRLVAEYSKRELTNKGDRLNAFMGVFDQLAQSQRASSSNFPEIPNLALAGIPQRFFYAALLWAPSGTDYLERIPCDEGMTPCLPSWSWTGWYGPVTLDSTWLSGRQPLQFLRRIDDYNLVLDPQTAGKLNSWKPWPFEPEPCHPISSEQRPTITLHLWAPVVYCFTDPLEKNGELYARGLGDDTSRRIRVGCIKGNGLMPNHVLGHEKESVGVIVFPNLYKREAAFGLVVQFDTTNTYAVRLPIAPVLLRESSVGQVSEYRHIRLQ